MESITPAHVSTHLAKKGIDEMKSTKKKTAKKATIKQPDFTPRELDADQQMEVEAIDCAGDDLGNAVVNFWQGIQFAQPFIKREIDLTITRAATVLGLENPTTEDDPITQLKKLHALYKLTGAEFELQPELTAADHLFALLNNHEVLDGLPQDLYDLLCDYLERKLRVAELDASIPESTGLPVIQIVLSRGVAADRERERMEK